MTQVCKDVGWDGDGFYCLRCGKAGYKSEAQARGHLSQCKGRAISRGVPYVETQNWSVPVEMSQQPVNQTVLPPGNFGYAGGLRESEKGGGRTILSTTNTLNDFRGKPDYVSVEYVQSLQNQINALETRVGFNDNHYNHLLMQKNQPEQYHSVNQDFFSQYKGIIIVGAILLFAVILSKQSNQCLAGSGSKGVSVGDIGGKALSKLVDAGISKGVSALFK